MPSDPSRQSRPPKGFGGANRQSRLAPWGWLEAALKAADKTRAPLNRDALIKEFMSAGEQLTHDAIVKRNRAVTA